MPILLIWHNILLTLFFVFLASTGLTWLIYRQAHRRGWLAIPNERSSHAVPTPTGGGVAIAVVLLASVAGLWTAGLLETSVSLALGSGGALVALVGWIDGRRHLKVRVRIVVHALAAILALLFLGGSPSLNAGVHTFSLGIFGSVLGFFWIVGLSNLYNFMDGIDGLLGAQTAAVGIAAGALLIISGASGLAFLAWVIAAVSAGFLVWNWHPAKIFMGDVGSVLIGFTFAVLAIATERAGALPALTWMILLGVVIVDAGLSTLRRVFKWERWFEAHHTFGYHQYLKRGFNHAEVSWRVTGINLALAVFALASFYRPILLTPALAISLVSLSWIWWKVQKRARSALV